MLGGGIGVRRGCEGWGGGTGGVHPSSALSGLPLVGSRGRGGSLVFILPSGSGGWRGESLVFIHRTWWYRAGVCEPDSGCDGLVAGWLAVWLGGSGGGGGGGLGEQSHPANQAHLEQIGT